MNPKFIITSDGTIQMAHVESHAGIARLFNLERDDIISGGWFYTDEQNETVTFYGESYDFGKSSKEDITKAVKECKVEFVGTNISNKYKFYYSNHTDTFKPELVLENRVSLPKSILSLLEVYLDNTDVTTIESDWRESEHLDRVGPTVEEYLKQVKSLKLNSNV